MTRWCAPLALLLAACGPMNGLQLDDAATVAYHTPVLRVDADEPTALSAVQRYVVSMGWSVDEVDAASSRVVAHVDTRDAYTLQRDTWTFQLTPGFVAVRRRVALGDTNATSFVTSDEVCGTYTYSAELDHLSRISSLITSEERGRRVARR